MTATRGNRAARQTRAPVTERQILSVKGKEPGYVYRIVNDVGDRIAELQDRGYELVDASAVRIGDKRVNGTKAEGTYAQVSVGGGIKAFVMRQKEEWYNEDQISKQARVNQLEDTIKQTPDGFTGSVKVTRE
jgi:hypothetical protein